MSTGNEWSASSAFIDTQKTAFDAWALCLRRKWLILFMVAVAAGLGYLYYSKATKIYETMSQILVIRKQNTTEMPIKMMQGEVVNENSLSTHMLLIRSQVIVERAYERYNLEGLKSLEGQVSPIDKIRLNLKAIRAGGREAPDANVMQVTYRAKDPEDAIKIIRAIIASYHSFLNENYQNISNETVELITTAKEELYKQLTEQRDAYYSFREQSPLRWTMADDLSIPELRMREIQKVLSEIMITRGQTAARIQAIEQCLRDGCSRESLLILVGKFGEMKQMRPDSTMMALEDQLFPLLMEEQMLLSIYGENHPNVKAVQKKIQIMTQYINNKRLDLNVDDEEGVNRGDFLSLYLESMQHELADADARQEMLSNEYKRLEAEAGLLSSYRIKEEKLRSEIELTQQLFDSVLKRFQELSVVKDYSDGYNNKTIAEPKLAYQVEPNIYKVMGVAVFAGVLLGFGLAYAVDMADKSFRGPEEVRQELGVPILGHIPVLVAHKSRRSKDKTPSVVGPMVLTHHQPKSTMAESYRAVRTALNFGTRGEGHKVIQITSPDPGDGKTTLSSNLAVSIAQSGKRVLLIDADFRRPRIHRAFGLEQQIGLSSVIREVAELPDAIQATEVDNLWILPCGPRPSNPSELLTQPRFKELIEMVRDQFDMVLIDTPPALAVTDPCVVAPRVDGVLLLLRITKHVRPHAKRAVEILESLGANMLGLVINGVGGGNPSVGYGFGQQYGYRYASSAGYYDQPYSDERYGEYYSEEDDEESLAAGRPSRHRNGHSGRNGVATSRARQPDLEE